MLILGIETSCDETAASVVKDGREILSHVLATSVDIHTRTGGVIPENAAREQVKSIIPVVHEALIKASDVGGWKWENGQRSEKLEKNTSHFPFQYPASHIQLLTSNIDAIAVTYGPGLIGSLLVGVETAKTLAFAWNKPIVPINHLIAHIYANWLEQEPPELPAVALVVSGGHTDLVYLMDHGDIKYIGGTRDDAAGEAFDKTARLLGLKGFMGGPAIAAEAAKFKMQNAKIKIKLPRPMLDNNNFDFSFSGLKTAVLREVEELKRNQQFNKITIQQLSFEIQEAITDVLVDKSLKAVKKYGVKTLLLAGGVAANQQLTEKFKNSINQLTDYPINFFVPSPPLCTDNASYIAACAHYNYQPVPWQKISANPSLTIMGAQETN